VTFKTHDPGVDIPEFLKERYPDEMTIVLQNQFWGLKVSDDGFEVGLTFQKLPATLVIPFAALTSFVDPSVQFGLQFRNSSAAKEQPESRAETGADTKSLPKPEQPPEAPAAAPQIVSLDKFRKK
jgi:hypothetical protein